MEWAQKEGKEVVFEVIEDKSLGQSRLFSIRAMVDGIDTGLGQDYSKKNAEKINNTICGQINARISKNLANP